VGSGYTTTAAPKLLGSTEFERIGKSPNSPACRRLQITTLYEEVGTEETLGIDASSPLAIRLPFPFYERLYQCLDSCQQVDI
jgi:hypothetical protein